VHPRVVAAQLAPADEDQLSAGADVEIALSAASASSMHGAAGHTAVAVI
jgi:hypothetical protein